MYKLLTKKALGLSLLIFLIAGSQNTLKAQELSISDALVKHEKELRPAIQVILEPKPDAVKAAWEDYLKHEHDLKLKGTGLFANKDVLSAEEVTVKDISPNAMNFYTRVVEKGDQTEMSVFASFGYDIFIEQQKYPAEYAQIKRMIRAFLDGYLPKYYQEQLDESQKLYEGLEKDRSKLADDIADNQKEIEKLTKENEKMENELSSTKKQLDKAAKTLKEREQKVKGIQGKLRKID